jgi:hypothetical protein
MTLAGTDISGAVPAVNPATEPASVRNGSPATQQAYSEALSFENILVNRLCQDLLTNSGLSGADGSGGGALGGFASLLPGALASTIMSDGGLGLAAQLLPSFESAAGSTGTGTPGPGVSGPGTA